MTTSPEQKTLDAALWSAFEAGAEFGVECGMRTAPPSSSTEDAYEVWRRRWTGVPHEDQGEPMEKAVARQAGTYAAGAKHILGDGWEARQKRYIDSGVGVEYVPEATVVRDLLLLVRDEYPRDVWLQEILSWNPDTRRKVVEWAAAVHLSASDNEGITIPPIPEVLL